MPTSEQIDRKKQEVARLERHLTLEKIKRRKADTRRKIELGGLVIKAGMHDFPKDVILGALIGLREEIESNDTSRDLYGYKGKVEFLKTT